ncbi:MAG: metal ABC transporter ATP-binding protein [Chloroflexi bacterium]|nr:metal ABC transporter ATP-binding protein [Chloroflexota bacterium]
MTTLTLSSPISESYAALASHPALALNDIAAEYDNGRRVLEGVTFSIAGGERAAVVGPNGAGKSTLFKVIVGLMPHLSGDVLVHGHSHHAGDCPSIGYVPQRESVDWDFPVTVMDVVLMGRVKEVFIARALAQRADVLLLDEPFGGVDVEAQTSMFEILDDLRARGVTVLISTHDLEMATTRFDRLILLNRRIIADGPAESVLTPERLAAAYGGRLTFWQNGQPVTVTADDCCP